MSHDAVPGFADRVRATIARHQLIDPGDHVLVAVSGGPDSVALLLVLSALTGELAISRLSVAHFNHQLRGQDSEKDAAFVRSLAAHLHLDCRLGQEDVAAHRRRFGLSLEMAARECRRRFLLNSARQIRADKVALGHNANDQAEELLLRLIRGTSPGGLSGMAPKTGQGLIRPLLELERSQILAYLQERGVDYRTDTSNLEPFCDRNRLRLQVLPMIERHINPKVTSSLCRHAQLAREEETWWAGFLEDRWQRALATRGPNRVTLRRPALQAEPVVVRRRLLKQALILLCGSFYGFAQVHLDRLADLAASPRSTGEIHLPRGVRACNEYDALVLSLAAEQYEPERKQPLSEGTTVFGPYTVTVCRVEGDGPPDRKTLSAERFTAWMDEDRLRKPLRIRTWQPGDRFRPLGMSGSKKLQDLFSDLKVPRRHRKCVPILCDAEKICWVAGYRLDERVKVRSTTKRILKVSIRRDDTFPRASQRLTEAPGPGKTGR